MPFSIRDELSPVVQQYAMYLRNVRGLSSKTVTEYCKDLRTFFRFVKRDRGLVPPETSLRNRCAGRGPGVYPLCDHL